MPIRSMRFRLTLLFLALFGGAQFLLWFVVDRVRTEHLMNEFDRQLARRAQSLLNTIRDMHAASDGIVSKGAIAEKLVAFEEPDLYFEVRGAHGEIVARSRNLTGLDLPFRQSASSGPADGVGPAIRTIDLASDSALVSKGGELRLATIHDTTSDGAELHIQVAADRRPMIEAVYASRQIMVIFGIVSLILAAQAAWFVTGRSLAPLRDLTRTAKSVSGARLGERRDSEHGKDEVGEAINAVNQMLDRLEREFHRLDRFVADISHELKTPLAVLLGEAQSLRHRPHSRQDEKEFVAVVEQETRRLLRTIDAFLILARAKAHVRLPVARVFALEDAALGAIQTCQPTADNKGVRILPTFDANEACGEPHVEGDADLVHSMFENLLTNAIRHAPADTTVDFRIACTKSEVVVKVRDRGPGIPQRKLVSIFDRFHRFDGGERAGASGLGLAIVKAVAQLHGGDVAVTNQPDAGCEFAVTLPLSSGEPNGR